jgi:hypothetical protein
MMLESIAKNYKFIEDVQLSSSFIMYMILNESKETLTTTRISEK